MRLALPLLLLAVGLGFTAALPPVALIACADDSPAPLAGGGSSGEARVVLLELYASQGCSSCPPAEEFLRGLRAAGYGREKVVTAAFHVDYWDRLGWKDPFSRAEWTERQTALDRALRLSNLYTPQLVIDGADAGATGERAALDRALGAKARAKLTLDATLTDALAVKGTVAPLGGELARGLEVEVLLLEDGLVTKIERGENRGRTIEEASVVRAVAKALTLERASRERVAFAAKLAVPTAVERSKLHVAAVLRDGRTFAVWQALDVALVGSR